MYKIEIGQHVYVGCTNNLRRRKDQHNGNARLGKSKFGRFLSENDIVLQTNDLVVINSFEDRKEALQVERTITKEYEKDGWLVLNDNYSKGCSRKGKHLGNTCKDYIVVDMREHTITEIRDLRQYGIKIGVDYRNLHYTLKGGFCLNRYKVFTLEGWESVKDKDLYLSGEIVEIKKKESYKNGAKKIAKQYMVLTPENKTIKVVDLDAFARKHNINAGNLHNSYNHPTHRASGYKVIKRI